MDNTYYTTSSYSTVSDSAAAAGFAWLTGTFILICILMFVAAYVFSAICLGRIFKKAGVESWIAWVPFYNTWKLLEIGGEKGAYIFFSLIPAVGSLILAIFLFISMHNIGTKLGKSGAFILLGIFLPPVWYIWLAFDKSQWNGGLNSNNITPSVTPITPSYAPQQPQQIPINPVTPPNNDQQQPPQNPQF